jgi:hypothetical protein
MITDHDAELRALLAAVLDRQAFGQDFGFMVTCHVVPVQGSFHVIRQIVITLRSPLLGQPPLLHTFPAPFGVSDATITSNVTAGAAELRKAAAAVLAQGNGNAKAAAK